MSHGPPYNPAYTGGYEESHPAAASPPAPMTGETQAKFPERPSFRDPFFAIIFLLHLVGILGLFTMGVIKGQPPSFDDPLESSDSGEIIELKDLKWFLLITALSLLGGGIWGFVYLSIMKMYAKQLIVFTMIASVIFTLCWALFFFFIGSMVGGLVFLVMAAIWGFLYYMWRKRIPFASVVLTTVSGLAKRYPATSYCAYSSMVVMVMWISFWFVAVYFNQYQEGGISYLINLFFLLSFYWVLQVIKNVVHVTVSGTFATWYFMADVPSNPTAKALKRALTTSFGSICLGSLLVALIKTLKAILRSMARESEGIGAILAWIAVCIIGCLDALLQYFNLYAFTQVAIYGKSFCHAAKDTWRLIKSHGIEAIINDNLISNVLMMGALLGGFLIAAAAALLSWIVFEDASDYWIIAAIIGGIGGLSISLLTMEVVESGVATLFVCFAMDPERLHQLEPELYTAMMETYNINAW